MCNLVWYWLTKDADEKQRSKVEAQLMKPLPGRAQRVTAAVVNYEMELFKKSMAKNAGR